MLLSKRFFARGYNSGPPLVLGILDQDPLGVVGPLWSQSMISPSMNALRLRMIDFIVLLRLGSGCQLPLFLPCLGDGDRCCKIRTLESLVRGAGDRIGSRSGIVGPRLRV